MFEVLAAGYAGLTTLQIPQIDDKFLHAVTFLILTITFYWIFDTTRRRTFNFTLVTVTLGLGVCSELLQAFLPNDRQFDPLDIAANLVGSGAALGLCTIYHKRMLERKRRRKGYAAVPEDGEDDVELQGQESGVVDRETDEDNEIWDDMDADEAAAPEITHDASKANGIDDKN